MRVKLNCFAPRLVAAGSTAAIAVAPIAAARLVRTRAVPGLRLQPLPARGSSHVWAWAAPKASASRPVMRKSTMRLRRSTTSRTPAAAPRSMDTVSDDRSLWQLGHVIDRHAADAPESTALVIGADRQSITMPPHALSPTTATCFWVMVCEPATSSLFRPVTASSLWSPFPARESRLSPRLIWRCRRLNDEPASTASVPESS